MTYIFWVFVLEALLLVSINFSVRHFCFASYLLLSNKPPPKVSNFIFSWFHGSSIWSGLSQSSVLLVSPEISHPAVVSSRFSGDGWFRTASHMCLVFSAGRELHMLSHPKGWPRRLYKIESGLQENKKMKLHSILHPRLHKCHSTTFYWV